MLKKSLLYLGLILPTAKIYANCPAGDVGYQSGCLIVNENIHEPDGDKIQIFYQWLGSKDPKKPTILMINGGPGGSLFGYKSIIEGDLNFLSDKYNILIYDQRGVGRSSHVSTNNAANLDLSLYMSDSHVEDLAMLVDKVIKKRPIVLGHSYGGMLAYAFAAKYPQKIRKLISLNGATDGAGMIMQSRLKSELANQVLSTVDQDQLNALFQLLARGEAVGSRNQKLDFQSIQLQLTLLLSTYKGQTEQVKAVILALIDLNRKAIDAILAENSEKSMKKYSIRVDADPTESFNFILNPYLICHEMINPDAFAQGDYSEADRVMNDMFFTQKCSNIFSQDKVNVFDVKPYLSKIKMPVLIVGSTHDPLVHLDLQKRDYQLLSQTNQHVKFVTFEKTGHQIFDEAAKCTKKTLEEFLFAKKPSRNQTETCDESQM